MIRESVFDIKQVSATLTDDIDFMVDYDCETECWLEVFGSRTRTDETNPICTNRVYIPAHFSGIKSELNNLNISVMQAIEEKYGVLVGRVYGSSRAVACPEKEASLLGLATGAPALRADAVLYVQSGEILELTVNHFDTNRFQHFFDVSID